MLTGGRKRGGKPGTGLSVRSVNLTLGKLRAAFNLAVKEGKLVRNVVARGERELPAARTGDVDAAEVHTFLRHR
jgi:hypothetical protein